MPRAKSPKVGRGPCLICSEPVTYRRSSGDMLTFRCDCCDLSGYAAPGGDAYKKLFASITDKPDPVPAADPEPTAQEKLDKINNKQQAKVDAAAKRVNSAFSLGDLR